MFADIRCTDDVITFEGLIRAKVFGVEHSSGEVLVFIDSHCECNDGWRVNTHTQTHSHTLV